MPCANVCIFAPKGETIKKALCEDGRFLPILKEGQWKLVDDNNVVSLNNYSVDGIANKIYTVEFCNKVRNITAGPSRSEELATASPGQHDQASHSVKQSKLDPKLKEQKEWIKLFFEEEVEECTTKRKEKVTLKTVLELHRKQFGKTTKNSTPVRVHKLLAEHSASVGYIKWNYYGKGSCGTCFALPEGYILTCYHIFSEQLGQGFEQYWAEFSQYVRITFSYEDQQIKDDWFFVEPCLEMVENTLDYVVLKLQKGNAKLPDGLSKHYSPPPPFGLIYIIGHPDGNEKSTDGCSIITPLERGWRCTERLQEKLKEDCSPTTCGPYHASCIHIFTPRSFQEVVSNKDKVTYDTTFFFGSSGSPVFSASGQLIAMHAGGYVYNYHEQEHSIIEWGYSMEAIFKDLENKVPGWFESRGFMRGSEGPTGGNEADVRKLPADVIMESDSGSE
ncbi:serine protease FAM111A-like [Alligator mississippiensis]|uniref:serine protease FAM111A-like n=1 Tax=Alligator mississippiensis TaxID=8496 RepID=UPI0009073D3C|nr:serine protease FAM111A-like [Alligator mississippiensis]